MSVETDWRLNGQENYLGGRAFQLRRFPPGDGAWDHEHCAFCWQRISAHPGDEQEGYASLDGKWWVCRACFFEFSQRLGLRLFDPAHFAGEALSQIIAVENACPGEYPGLHLTGEVIALCQSLEGVALAGEQLRVVPYIVYRYPRAAAQMALPEWGLVTPPEALAERLTQMEGSATIAAALDRAGEAWQVDRGLLRLCVSIQAERGQG